MKKRFLSLLLVLTLALALCVPALAYEGESTDPKWESTDPERETPDPEWETWKAEWLADHPQEAADFDADAYYENVFGIGWYYSKEAFMQEYSLESEAEFDALMLEMWLNDCYDEEQRQVWMDEYEAAHPGAISGFDADAWFMEHYYVDPKQSFMEEAGLETQDEFKALMLTSFVDTMLAAEARQTKLEEYEAAHPGIIAAFDPDTYFAENYSWWDGGKEDYMRWMDLATEEDFRADMLENLISDDSWSQDWEEDRNQDILDMGGIPGQLGVMVDGTYLTFPEGKAPYAAQGATYVYADTLNAAIGSAAHPGKDGYTPLRAAAEAVGYDVLWDGAYQTVVLVDKAGFIQETDSRFTVLNGVLSKWAAKSDAAKNYKTDLNVTAEWKQFDSLDGDKTWTLTGSANAVSGPAGLEMNGKYDFSAFMDILSGMDPYLTEYEDQAMAELYAALLKGKFDLRMDSENGMLYLRMSMLPYLLSTMGESCGANTWFSTSLGDDVAAALPDEALSVGSLLYLMEGPSSGWSSSIYTYQNLQASAALLAGVVGDERFEKKGNDYVLTLGKEGLGLLLDPENPEYYTEDIQDFALTVTVKADGTVTGSILFRPVSYYYFPAQQLSATWSLSSDDLSLDVTYHLKNQGELHLVVTGKTAVTSQAPAVTPPAKDPVVSLDDMGS